MEKTEHPRYRLSVAQFAELPEEEGFRLELVRGSVVREPAPGLRHSRVALAFLDILREFGERAGLGLVFFDTGFVVNPTEPTVRVPDVAFVSSERLPQGALTDELGEGAPDVVVEVVSPSNSASALQRKALDYLDGGARLVWAADPEAGTVTVYQSRSKIQILEGADLLTAEGVIPGLEARVDQLLGRGPEP